MGFKCPIDSLPMEILEMVLLNLEMKDLLVNSQRVCRKWTACIQGSPRLQQELFMLPAREDSPRVINPLLAEQFPFWFQTRGCTYPPADEYSLKSFLSNRKDSILQPGASWRRMLIQQPPITSLGWLEIYDTDYDPTFDADTYSFRQWYLPFPEGVRMSSFYDMAVDPVGGPDDMVFHAIWALEPLPNFYWPLEYSIGVYENAIEDVRNYPRSPITAKVVIVTGDQTINMDGVQTTWDPYMWGSLEKYTYPHADPKLETLRSYINLAYIECEECEDCPHERGQPGDELKLHVFEGKGMLRPFTFWMIETLIYLDRQLLSLAWK